MKTAAGRAPGLRVVSDTGDGSDRVLAARKRQQRHRERLRAGRIQLVVEVDRRLIEALLSHGAVTEAEALSRHAVGAALGEMVDDWTRRALSVTA